MLQTIVTPRMTRRNPPVVSKHTFNPIAYNSAVSVEIPDAKPMDKKQAEQFLLGIEMMLQKAGMGLMGFKLAISGPCDKADFDIAYRRFIVENGLHVWLSPGEAADIWQAVRAVKEVD